MDPEKLIRFFELGHVVQYTVLGVLRFITRYVRSWFDTCLSYCIIPLDTQAFTLQQRYEKNPRQGFPVKDVVCESLGERW